uniref:Homeobox domain-containing protein n=1 Tax=Globodera rostochiensis TaxID=31243 RepID=A0A914GQX2_GLORO
MEWMKSINFLFTFTSPSAAAVELTFSKIHIKPPTPELNGLKQQLQVLEAQNSDVNAQLVQERERAQMLERERNFYFDKLRTIEILCGSCAMADGGLGGGGILRVDQCASSTDGGSSAHTRLSPQPRGDLPRLESPDVEQMHAMFKQHQLRTMKIYFQKNHNPDAKDLKLLAQKTGLTKRVLQVWFQDARAKHRRTQQHRGEIGGMDGSMPSLFTAMSVAQMHASSVPSSTSVGSGGAIHGEYTPNVGLRTMKIYFKKNHNPDAKDLKLLAQKTGLTKRVLQVWFQDARAKHRRTQQHRGEIGGMDGSMPSLFTAMSITQMHASSVPSSTSVGSGGAIHGEYTPNVGHSLPPPQRVADLPPVSPMFVPDTAHLEDTFLLGGAVGSASSAFENGSGTTVRPNQPILDISDDKSVAEGGTERVESRQLEKDEQDSAVGLNNETFNTSEKRASTLLNLTHPVLSDGGIEGMAEASESNRTQTLEGGPTLMNTTHPVPTRGTTGNEPPQQQQQVQDGQNEA